MAHLAFAVDGSVTAGELTSGYEADAAIGLLMAPFIGSDLLIYRVAELHGGYFGIARLRSIGATDFEATLQVQFDKIRIFHIDLGTSFGMSAPTRLQLLDDKEFSFIVSAGQPSESMVNSA